MAEEEEAMETGENGQDRSDQVERRANRIIKIFGQITECLEDVKVARIKEMLSQIIDICKNKGEKPVQELNKIYLEYLVMVEFRAGISVNLIKLSIQSFLMIEGDPEVLGKRVNDMFLEIILTEHPSLALDMNLSDELLKTYFRLLSEGTEPALHMRIMIVGMFGVGKTSLQRRLCHESLDNVKSTEVIDIFTKTCEVQEDGDWKVSPDKDREKVYNVRLHTLLKKYKKQEEVKQTPTVNEHNSNQPTEDQPENAPNQRNHPITEHEKRNVNFEEFSSKVDPNDLNERNNLEQTTEITRLPTISIWDFAGQSVYYSTHHFFLNERSIYLLVLDLSKELNDMVEEDDRDMFLPGSVIENRTKFTCLDAFKFWVKSIYIYTKQKETHASTARRLTHSPKIVLIGTHRDEITDKQLGGRTYEEYKDVYFDKALQCFTKRPMADLVHPKKFLVNSKTPDENEFLEIKREIFNIARKGPFSILDEEIPARFLPLERAVFHSKIKDNKIMRFEDLQEENRKLEFPSNEIDIKLFLAFQHAFGNVIYFNTKALHNTVILTPQWIIKVFKAFVKHQPNKELAVLDKWHDFKERGILREELIEKLLEHDIDLYSYKNQVVKYLEHMDVIVRPFVSETRAEEFIYRRSAFHDDDRGCVSEKFHIMPCMLPKIPNLEELKACFNWFKPPGEKSNALGSNTPTLCLYFKQCFLPPFVVHCLLASFVKKMPIKILNGKDMLYNGLGSFSFQDKTDGYLTLWSYEDILHFKISFIDTLTDEEKTKFCILWREKIELFVLEIFNFHGKETYTHENRSILFEYRIKCPKCKEQMPCEQKSNFDSQTYDYMCGLFNVSDLIGRKPFNVQCSACGELNVAKNILQDWFAEDIDGIKDCLKELPEEDKLADLSNIIPKDMIKRLGVELCINEKAIENIEVRDHGVFFTFRVLLLWKNRIESWNVLYEALPKAGIHIEKACFFRIINGVEDECVLKAFEKFMGKLKTGTTIIDATLLPKLADCIGGEFWLLGVRLGIKDSAIRRMMVDYKKSKYVCWEILKEWHTEKDSRIQDLIKAMIKSDTDMSAVLKVLQSA